MRITQNMMTDQFIYNITNTNNQMQNLENELSTGKTLNEPSDNPLAVSQDMSIRSSLSQTTAYQSTINSGLTWMQNTSSALSQMQTALNSIQNVVSEGINSTNQSPSSLQALSETAQQLAGNIYQELNAQQGTRYLFGGTNDLTAPSSITSVPYPTTNTPIGTQYSIEQSFQGSVPSMTTTGGAIATSIAGTSSLLNSADTYSLQLNETVNASGTPTTGLLTLLNATNNAIVATGTIGAGATSTTLSFGAGKTMTVTLGNAVSTSAAGSFTLTQVLAPQSSVQPPYQVSNTASGSFSYEVASNISVPINVSASDIMLSGGSDQNLQSTLQSITGDLLAGNTSALQNDLSNLQSNMTDLTNISANVGSRIQRLTALQNQMGSYQTTLTNDKGVIQGANMAQVMTQYTTDQAIYSASLQMGAQILLPSLVNFLPNG